MEIIVLSILVGLSVLVMGTVFGLQIVTGSRERRELQKLLKSKDLQEYVQLTQPDEEVLEDDSNLVELENMDSVISERLDKNERNEGN
jgi:hypothetical protein